MRTDAAGLVGLGGLPPTQHVVRVHGAAAQRAVFSAGDTTAMAFTIPRGFGIEGRVFDVFGAPVVGASLWLTSGHEINVRSALPVAESGTGGHFRIAGVALPARCWLAARAPDHTASNWRFLLARDAQEASATLRNVELRLGANPASIRGTCFGPNGDPLAGVHVGIAMLGAALKQSHGGRFWPGQEFEAMTAADGRFRFDGVAAATWNVTARVDGMWFDPREVVVATGTAVATVLTGERAATIHGLVVDDRAEPATEAFVRIPGYRWARANADARGEFEIYDLPPRRVELRAFADGFDDLQSVQELHAGSNPIRLAMRRQPRFVGTARDARGQPIAGWQLGARPVDSESIGSANTVAADGRFEVPVASNARHTFYVRLPSSPFRIDLDRLGARHPSPEPFEVVVPDSVLPTAQIVGRLPGLGADQRYVLSIRNATQQSIATFGNSGIDDTTGRFRIGPLPTGPHFLHVQVRRKVAGSWGVPVAGTAEFGPFQLAAGETLDVGQLLLPEPGQLDCVLTPAAGCNPTMVRLEWRAVDGKAWGLLNITSELDATWPVYPGEYEVTIWGEGFLSLERRVTVLAPPAPPTRLAAALAPGQRLPLELTLPENEERATFAVRDAAGRLVYEDEFGTDESAVVQRYPVLGRGRHTVEVTGATGRRFEGEFLVESLNPTKKALRFELREVR
ncbi:MAG: carboxypeptidase-like regulatory domain-containing protein [bacterium]|nr:carboxypeptidase-like regulatory domain-containing protein [bacterium]